jgi:hypothetical protein
MRLAGPPTPSIEFSERTKDRSGFGPLPAARLDKNSGRSRATLLAAQPMLEEALDGEVGEDILTRAARPRCRKARDT